ILFILTIQTAMVLLQKPKHKIQNPKTERRSRWLLLLYIFVTFALATVGTAANAKYSQMIWIDLRDSGKDPNDLIVNELEFWINRLALTSYYVMSWILDLLLLQRCFVIWNWNILVIILMSGLLLTNIGLSITSMVAASKGAIFTNLPSQLAYLVISVSTNFLYTILVAGRLLVLRRRTIAVMGKDHAKVYVSVAALVVESSALYSCVGVLYVVTFALHSDVGN
ncbi:hypothetical protein M422DRAFT_91024, partial [Sphaerobolus stellatus SS14]